MAKGMKTGGRQKGTPNKNNQPIIDKLAELNCDPIEGKIYWTEHWGNRIGRCDLDGGNVEYIVQELSRKYTIVGKSYGCPKDKTMRVPFGRITFLKIWAQNVESLFVRPR